MPKARVSKWSNLALPVLALVVAAIITASGASADTPTTKPAHMPREATALTDEGPPGLATINNIFEPLKAHAPLSWVDRTPEATRTSRHAAVSDGMFMYTIGGQGHDGTAYTQLNIVQRYDPNTNTYSSRASLPITAYSNIEACFMNGKIYVPGGYDGTGPPFNNTLFIYTISSDSWTTGAPVPGTARLWYSAVCKASANTMYVIGGYDGTSGTNTVSIYDSTANTWSAGAPMPDLHYGSEGGLINNGNDIIIATGWVDTTDSTETLIYNIASNSWSVGASMSVSGLFATSGTAPDGKFWVAGGGFNAGGNNYLTRVEHYDPVADAWSLDSSMPFPVRHFNGGIQGTASNYIVDGFGGSAVPGTARCLGNSTGGAVCDYTQQDNVIPGAPTDTPTSTPTVTRTSTPLGTPTCLPQLVMFDGSRQRPGVLNANAKPLKGGYGFSTVATRSNPGKAEYMVPDASFILYLDDGSLESAIGFGNQAADTETSAIWLNRFSPGAPLVLPYSIQNLSIYWPDQNGDVRNQTFITQTPKILIYFDATTDNGPADATLLYQQDVTILVTNTWRTYNINPGIVINQPGDIYAGFIDQWADGGGYQPELYSAALDSSIPHQLRSWISYSSGDTPPDINNLGNNVNQTIETASGGAISGNWGFRLTGSDSRPGSCPPTRTPNVSPTTSYPTRTLTPTRSPTATPPCGNNSYYSVATSTATLVPGSFLVPGSQGDEDIVSIVMPFLFRFYGLEFSTLNASTNGNLQLSSLTAGDYRNSCLPAISSAGPMNNVIFGYWDDLDMSVTPTLGTSGIYTSVSNVAPNRTFNIEYRACIYNNGDCGGDVNFEVRLYENSSRIDMIYGSVVNGGSSATVGIQQRTGTASNYFTEYSCNTTRLSPGLQLRFIENQCAPTATPTCPPFAGIEQTIGLNNPGKPKLVKGSNNGPYKFLAAGGKVAPTEASGFVPNSPITMQVDDGSRDDAVSFGTATTSTAAIWLNRFSPWNYNLPMTITQISVLWPTNIGGTLVGKTVRLLVYSDADGDNNPSNAALAGQASVVIGSLETFENYPLNIPVAAVTGDVYIGFEDQWAEGGYTPRLYSSSSDETRPQARSWLIGMSNGADPDLNNLGNNDVVATNDSIGMPGNWMIRASANTADRSCQPASVINGHLTWAGISQPNPNNNGITATLVLCNGSSQVYSGQVATNNAGNFSIITGLPDGTYTWKLKNIMSLRSSGSLTITGSISSPELGLQRAGDCNDTNIVDALDFTILKGAFGKSPGQAGYDARADFNRDHAVNVADFALLKNSFGHGGAAQTCP